MKRLPDVIGVGFRRCASSWLHSCLNEHPEVGKTAGGIHFFSNHLERGVGWYQEKLAPFSSSQVLVDFSVSYGYPENIDAFVDQLPGLVPNVKLFAVMRHPVERAFSDYRRSLFREELPPGTTFEQAIERDPEFLNRGCYGQITRKLCQNFHKERIGFFFYDDIQTKPCAFWSSFCDFLDISSDFTPSLLRTPTGHVARPKNAIIHSFIRRTNQVLTATADAAGLDDPWSAMKRSRIWRKAVTLNTKQDESIAPNTRQRLLSYYADDIRLMSDLSGRDLSRWLT